MKININNMKNFVAASLTLVAFGYATKEVLYINEIIHTEQNKQEAIYDVSIDSRDDITSSRNTENQIKIEIENQVKEVIKNEIQDDVKKIMIENAIKNEVNEIINSEVNSNYQISEDEVQIRAVESIRESIQNKFKDAFKFYTIGNDIKVEIDETIKEVIKNEVRDELINIIIENEIKNQINEITKNEVQIEVNKSMMTGPIVENTINITNEKDLFDTFEELTENVKTSDLTKEINDFREKHYEEIFDVTNPEYHDIHVQYGALVYKRLVEAGIPKKTILNELNNVIIEQQLPRDISEKEWHENFGNIVSVLGEQESMYESYFCLAYLVHDEMCELEHEQNEFYGITCDNLEEGFQKKYNLK